MMLRIHQGARCENPRVYDAQHHSLETRHTRSNHKTCSLFTPKSYARSTLQETEQTFFSLALQLKFADSTTNTIVPVYFADLDEQGTKVGKRSNNKPKAPINSTAKC